MSEITIFGGRAPNKAEQHRHDVIRETGCIICLIFHKTKTPPEIHHVEGKTSEDAHNKTLGLCYWHHRADKERQKNKRYTSRHDNKTAFEERYLPEPVLLEIQNKVIERYEQLKTRL